MNKKLIALAVAGACFASDAMAQTANPVTLYGRAYLTLESIEAKGATLRARTRWAEAWAGRKNITGGRPRISLM